MSAAAYADDSNTGLGNASGGSTATSTTASGNSIDNGNTDSSKSGNTLDSGNTDTSKSGNTVASNNTVTKTHTDVDVDADAKGEGNATTGGTASNSSKSGNTVASNNTDTDANAKGSGNATTGGSANNTKTWDNNNDQSHNYTDSHNYTNSSTNNITATVSNQDLSGSVSGIHVRLNGQDSTSGASTGAITGNTYTSFAGIQTANSNTGVGSLGQAATSIAANANVTFGTP
jgi:hypothetical protein